MSTGTHFKGPVDSLNGFTVNGVALAGSGGAQALIDNTGGTDAGSLEAGVTATTAATVSVTATAYTATALTTPTDSPATADALRDNLVATTLADVTTNFTALQTRLALDRTDLTALFTQMAAHKVDIEAIATQLNTINDNFATLYAALAAGGIVA